MYLAEEALLEHLRRAGLVPRRLFEEDGLCLEVVSAGARILHALHMDDEVRTVVRPAPEQGAGERRYAVEMFVTRGGKPVKAYAGRLNVVYRRDASLGLSPLISAPEALRPYLVEEVSRQPERWRSAAVVQAREAAQAPAFEPGAGGARPFVWRWHVPYFYCHYNERLQMSGYLRLLEEVENLFLADRGLSIWTMLRKRRWIPVVPTARVEVLREAYMEEPLYTVYTLEGVTRNVTYDCRMDCYVQRGGSLVHTSVGHITHGYAIIDDRKGWRLVELDEPVVQALKGPGAAMAATPGRAS
jgi:acyl-CoA thioesterase FadM